MFSFDRKSLRHLPTLVIPALVATLAAVSWPPEKASIALEQVLKPLHRLEWSGYDAMFYWRGPAGKDQIDPRIVIIGFDTNAEMALGQPWPLPRRYHAKVVENLVRDGAKVIVFDVHFPDASKNKEDDLALDRALAKAPNAVLACRVERDVTENRTTLHAPYYNDELGIDFERSAVSAFVEVPTDTERVGNSDSGKIVRRLMPVQKYQDEWLPSLATAAYMALTDQKDAPIAITPDAVQIGRLRVPRTGPTARDPVNPKNELTSAYIDFPAGIDTFPIYRYEAVYENRFAPQTFKDKVVFIGLSGTEYTKQAGDQYVTAFSRFNTSQAGANVTSDVFGVVVQAQSLNALLKEAFIRQAPWWHTWLLVFALATIGTWAVRSYMNWRGPGIFALVLFLYGLIVYQTFTMERTYIPWMIPGLFLLTSVGGVAWLERGRLRKKWAGYVSPAYLEVMLREGYDANPKRYEATVIFGDIRGFTSFSEKHQPETVVRLLDKHLEKLVHIVFEEKGTVDKFLGDGILVVFGAPNVLEDAPLRGVKASWRMREASDIPITDTDGTVYTFGTGFGITTGPLVAGHVGSKELSSFTLIGDTVNLSSRLQGVTGRPDVIIDENTYQAVRRHVEVESLGAVQLKGKTEPVACYKVLSFHEEPMEFPPPPREPQPDNGHSAAAATAAPPEPAKEPVPAGAAAAQGIADPLIK